ncbi:eukaryotic translation elongation factor 1 beta [Carabus blaptoides fortunei]
MTFGNLKSEAGCKELNNFLADNSYVNGYQPSNADIETFNRVGKAPAAKYSHALRWYNHIKSFTDAERKALGDGACPLTTAGTTIAPVKPEEDAEATKIREERLKAYAAKKSTKPALIAKSSIVLDVKPWDDETDMKAMENQVRTIIMEGLVWGASKLVPVGYGINKLQIMCVVEDDKVSVDLLTEKIQDFEDFVQSVDIAAFNKI